MKYEILKEEIVFDQFFKIKKAKIRQDCFDSTTIEIERLCFERGDSVAILLYEKDTDSFLFTNQFRYPTIKEKDGWILELTAGSVESAESNQERMGKEVAEEIGYQVNEIELIHTFFVSPGGSSERIALYYATVRTKDKVYEGGGVATENEDIQLVKIKTNELIKAFHDNRFRDAKTIIGIQWFLLNRSVIE
ncbi:ADP-ribose pyrophosphatase [Putridiphycobacter roseus]|uniref:GDP-mannose pyrophosphatase n=1 Tax=Putridiphycobacter roseus TaxID=2219161 RepID=A0A2W1NGK6_9FLAO|nr:NUDIX hydrolase [Putridiphycobacter roseus]PZE18243.1 ADP-ribose pyrophosphatase [Putridiphycobacter roseus]